MSELPDDKLAEAARTDGLLLEYDYMKHLSTIALVAIGAILTWAQGAGRLNRTMVMAALALIAISAALCFGGMSAIIAHRKTGRPLRRLFDWERQIASATFAIGLGLSMSEIGNSMQ